MAKPPKTVPPPPEPPHKRPPLIKVLLLWGGLSVASLAYANYAGIRLLNVVSGPKIDHSTGLRTPGHTGSFYHFHK